MSDRMELTRLRREVLPPRQAPASPDFVSEAQVRAAITQAIWMSAALVGLAHIAARMLGTW